MSWRFAACTVASFLAITLPALAQPSTTPSTRPPTDQNITGSSQVSAAQQELIWKLEKAGYTQVRDVKSTAEGIVAEAMKSGKEVSFVLDSSGPCRELEGSWADPGIGIIISGQKSSGNGACRL